MAPWNSVEQNAPVPYSHPWLAEALFVLDTRLRRRQSVVEFSTHPSCIFRLNIDHARRTLVLGDGTPLRKGERVGRLHLWNGHIPPMPRQGATIGWARQMQHSIALSLRELARYLSSRPELRDIAVICADVPSGTRAQSGQLARIMAHYGFEVAGERESLPLGRRLHRLGENLLISLVVFAQNASALRLDTLGRIRLSIFMSRRALEQRFGATAQPPARGAAA